MIQPNEELVHSFVTRGQYTKEQEQAVITYMRLTNRYTWASNIPNYRKKWLRTPRKKTTLTQGKLRRLGR